MMRPGGFRRQQPTRANSRSVAAMMLSGATDKALANMTTETLVHSYALKPADAAQMLSDERGRRERRCG